MIRSILAVISGYLAFYLAMMILWLAFGYGPRHEVPSTQFLVISAFFEALFALGSGYLIAYLAKRRELLHAGFLAGVLVISGILYLLCKLNHYPAWVPWVVILVHAPCVLLGAFLRKRKVHA